MSEILERLLREFPESPWADDAAWRLARLLLDEGETGAGERVLEGFSSLYPGSPHQGAVGLQLAESLAERGEIEPARRVLRVLLDGSWVVRKRDRYPREFVSVAELARERLESPAGLLGDATMRP